MKSISALASSRLDLMRGLAALAVFLSHARALFFADFDPSQHQNPAFKLLYAVTGFGHQAVMVFFVMSGFLITKSILSSVRRDRWSWGDYSLNRLSRLLVVLVPAIALGAILDRMGVSMFGLQGAYGGQEYAHVMHSPVPETWGPTVALGNLAFLQGIFVPSFGSNAPLWSLSYEFWYYAMFPLLYFALRPGMTPAVRAISFVLAVLIAVMVKVPILSLFPVWLLGAALAFIKPLPARIGRTVLVLGSIALVGILAIVRVKTNLNPTLTDLVLGLAFFVVMLGVLAESDKTDAPWYHLGASGLARMSYTLYLVHLPLLVFLNAWIIGVGPRWEPSVVSFGYLTAVCAAVFGYAWAISLVTEARTAAIRDYLKGRFTRMPAEAVSA